MALKTVFHKWVSDMAPLNTAEVAGTFLSYDVTGSGFPLGDAGKTFKNPASSSGAKPAGVLTQKVVALDETLYTKNFWANEAVTGYTVEVIRKGEVYTDMLVGSDPSVGDPAYLSSSGYVTKTNLGAVATPLVGEFQSKKDENGFVKLFIDLP
jgi:hypothetical protein